MSFYKKENDELLFGDFITLPDYTILSMETKDSIEEWPVMGWYYFDSEENAKEFFGIQ